MMEDQERKALLAQIKEAFPLKPNDWNAFFGPESNDGVSEYWQVRKFLEGKTWDAITAESLRGYEGDEQAILAFVTDQGFRYYLPAFLTIALEVLEEHPSLAGSVIYYLTPGSEPEDAREAAERYAGLSIAQRGVIRAWLEYLERKKDTVKSYSLRPGDALARYWRR